MDKMTEKREFMMFDHINHQFCRTEAEEIEKIQKKINEELKPKGFFQMDEVWEIITRDWPEDEKARFFNRLNSHCGWVVNKDNTIDLRLANATVNGEKIDIEFDL